MCRRRFCCAALLCLLLLAVRVEDARAQDSRTEAIPSIGIYTCYESVPTQAIPFFKACGYNTYQCWDQGWAKSPANHERYYGRMARDIERMQAAGFRVYVILAINIVQCRAGEREDNCALFDPGDEKLMRERLQFLTATVQNLKKADGFTVFAGDPGGYQTATPAQCTDVTKKIIAMIAREAPKAEINVNTWGIAAWDKFPSPFAVEFWEKEVQLSRDLLGRPDVVGANSGVEFPLHNYYRSLTLKCYVDAKKTRELYPSAAEVAGLRQRGVKRLWGWPYFLADECDDGYSGSTAGKTQAETRYLKKIIDSGRQLGLNGMIANAMAPNVFAESLNLYAFARFCKDPTATPEQVILEFSGFISEPKTAGDLAMVLRFIENRSTWQAGMPEKYRLPNFDVGSLRSAKDALDLLAKVTVRKQCPLPMEKPPAAYVEKLTERLEMLVKEDQKTEAAH
jgi:hypothetical protein